MATTHHTNANQSASLPVTAEEIHEEISMSKRMVLERLRAEAVKHTIDLDSLVSTREIADLLHVDPAVVWKAARRGRIKPAAIAGKGSGQYYTEEDARIIVLLASRGAQ